MTAILRTTGLSPLPDLRPSEDNTALLIEEQVTARDWVYHPLPGCQSLFCRNFCAVVGV